MVVAVRVIARSLRGNVAGFRREDLKLLKQVSLISRYLTTHWHNQTILWWRRSSQSTPHGWSVNFLGLYIFTLKIFDIFKPLRSLWKVDFCHLLGIKCQYFGFNSIWLIFAVAHCVIKLDFLVFEPHSRSEKFIIECFFLCNLFEILWEPEILFGIQGLLLMRTNSSAEPTLDGTWGLRGPLDYQLIELWQLISEWTIVICVWNDNSRHVQFTALPWVPWTPASCTRLLNTYFAVLFCKSQMFQSRRSSVIVNQLIFARVNIFVSFI